MIYAICCTNRTGSTYLSYLLEQTRVMGCPGEFANPPDAEPERFDTDDYWACVMREWTRYGAFALKTAPAPYLRFRRRFPVDRHIWLRRRDVDAQAVSQYRAEKSGVWLRSPSMPAPAVPFDRAAIVAAREWIEDQNREWARIFAAEGVTPLPVWYEDLRDYPAAVVKTIARYLGRPLAGEPSTDSPYAVMRDELTDGYLKLLRENDA